jgi:fatty-acyl-CoA synthase
VDKFNNLIQALEAAPPDRVFVTSWIDEDESVAVTFADFRGRARSLALRLRESDVQAGDRVLIVMPQGIAGMAAFAGAMMLGAVPAFLAYPNFKIAPDKYRTGLKGVTANLNAKAVMIDDDFPEDMLSYVSLGGDTRLLRAGAVADTNDEKESSKDESDGREAQFIVPQLGKEDLAFIQHSAGTTGLQKGVALTHGAVLRQIELLSHALTISDADRVYSWLPLYHDMGLIACFILPMVCHLPVVMQSPLDWVMHPESMLRIITDHQCTLAWMPNFAFQFLPRRTPARDRADYDLSSLRALINCSEPVRESSMDEFRRAFAANGLRRGALQSCYAMAENVFAVTQSSISAPEGAATVWANARTFRTQHSIAETPPETSGSICFLSSGRLLPNHRLRIVSDFGAELGDGLVGEILIQSDCLFSGYYNRPDLSAAAVIDGWYHTGDLGFCLAGELFVVGRKKDLIIVGGENLYPQDIEEVVGTHAAIHEGRVVALGLFNSDLGTDEIIVVAEVEREEMLAGYDQIERDLRNLVVAASGVAVKTFFLKPPKWIIKSTAGKASRSGTREKLLHHHPELQPKAEEDQLA